MTKPRPGCRGSLSQPGQTPRNNPNGGLGSEARSSSDLRIVHDVAAEAGIEDLQRTIDRRGDGKLVGQELDRCIDAERRGIIGAETLRHDDERVAQTRTVSSAASGGSWQSAPAANRAGRSSVAACR